MEEGDLALLQDEAKLVLYQGAGVTLSQMIGVRAYGTDLGVRRYVKPLPCHGYQLVIGKHPVIMPKGDGSGAKRPGLGQCGQLYHLRHVPFLQGNREEGGRREGGSCIENKLQALYLVLYRPAFWLADGVAGSIKDPAFAWELVVQVRKPVGIAFIKAGKG